MFYRIKIPVVSMVFLLTTVPPVNAQSISRALLGHERQIGPIEHCVYTSGLAFSIHPEFDNLTSRYLSSSLEQGSLLASVIGGAIGGTLGILPSAFFANAFAEGSLIETEYTGASLLSWLLIQPLCTSIGVQYGDYFTGDFLVVYLASFVPWFIWTVASSPLESDKFPLAGFMGCLSAQILLAVTAEEITAVKARPPRRP